MPCIVSDLSLFESGREGWQAIETDTPALACFRWSFRVRGVHLRFALVQITSPEHEPWAQPGRESFTPADGVSGVKDFSRVGIADYIGSKKNILEVRVIFNRR